MSKITIYDIAKALGVNASTVNRAINGKPGVGEKKKQQILEYAQKHGYKANQAAKSLNRTIKFAYLQKPSIGVFDDQLIDGIKAGYAELESYNVSLNIFSAKTKTEYFDILSNIKKSDFNAAIIQPIKSSKIDELCADLAKAGIPVATVVSDIAPSCRLFTVHLDGFTAGSTASELLALAGCNKTAYFCGDPEYNIHKEMIAGFKNFAEKHSMQIINFYNDNTSQKTARENCRHMLSSHNDIQGVFIGTANSVPICEEIAASGKNIRIVSMDVFKEIAEYIKSGVISASLYQQPCVQSYTALKSMYRYLQDKEVPTNTIISPEIVLKSNLRKFNNLL